MPPYVLRCWQVPARVGKSVRRAIRYHWNVGHRAAHVIYHGGIVTGLTLVCVAVPVALAVLPPAAGIVPGTLPAAPQSDRGFSPAAPDSPPMIPFVPGLLFHPPGQDVADIGPSDVRVPTGPSPADDRHLSDTPLPVPEPASIFSLGSGLGLLLLLRRIRRQE